MLVKFIKIIVAVFVACSVVALADAEDLFQPHWRGKSRTTFQNWTFDDGDNPAAPEQMTNPYGNALAQMVVHPVGGGWSWDEILNRYGVWGDLTNMDIAVDNLADTNGRKEVRIQITYYHPPSDLPVIDIPFGTFLSDQTVHLEVYGFGSWFLLQEVWEIDPNPAGETINITTDPGWGMTIDQVVVDTACFPAAPFIRDVERNALGNVEITWTSDSAYSYSVEVSTGPYDYNEAGMTWTRQAVGVPGSAATTTWQDDQTPASGMKFYRIYAEGPEDQKAGDTVGMIVLELAVGRNMISSPFEPYPEGGVTPEQTGQIGASTLDKVIGGQLTGSGFSKFFSDTVEVWDNISANYVRAWYNAGSNKWEDWDTPAADPQFGWYADVGYWATILAFNPPKDVMLFGRVSPTDREIDIDVGRNLVGSCFPLDTALEDTGLVDSGFTGGFINFFSDTVEFWNNAAGTYDRFWHDTTASEWKEWLGGGLRDIRPGDAFWVTVLAFNSPFTWTYPK